MKKIILSVALTALVCTGFFSFKSITETRTKDYCIVNIEHGMTDYYFTIIFGDGKEETFQGKLKVQQNDLVNLFHKLNADGWEYKDNQFHTRTYNGTTSASVVNFIFERNHKE